MKERQLKSRVKWRSSRLCPLEHASNCVSQFTTGNLAVRLKQFFDLVTQQRLMLRLEQSGALFGTKTMQHTLT